MGDLRLSAERSLALFTAWQVISEQIIKDVELDDLLQTIVQQAAYLLEGSGGGFYVVDARRDCVICKVSYRTRGDFTGAMLQMGEGLAGTVAQSGQPLVIDDYRSWSGRSQKFEADQPFRAVIAAPVTWQGQVTGILIVLDDSEKRKFDENDLQILVLLANQAATVIENARLWKSERMQQRRAETLQQASAALTTSLNIDEVLENILTSLHQVIPYHSTTLFLLKGEYLEAVVQRNLPAPEELVGKVFSSDDVLFREIFKSRQALVLTDVQADARFQGWGGTSDIQSWMGVPLIYKDALIGILTCDHLQGDQYSVTDAILAQAFANQAAIALENARLFELEHTKLNLANTLQSVGALLTSQLPLSEVLENLLDLLKQVVDYDSASIHLLDASGTMDLAAGRGFEDIEAARRVIRTMSNHLLYNRWKDNHVMVIADTHNHPDWRINPPTSKVRSWIGAPLLVKGLFTGGLNVDSHKPFCYSQADAQTVMAFANQAAIAIENARLFEAERKRVAELEAVRQASIGVTASLELSQVLHSILESTMNLLTYAQNAHVFLYDQQNDQLTFGAALFADGTSGEPFSKPRPNGVTATVARTGMPIFVEDMKTHPLFVNVSSSWQGSLISLPLKIGQRVIGVMNVSFPEPRLPQESELRFLHLLGDQAAIAIENARLFEQAATERSHLGLLFDISRELTRSLDPKQILSRAISLTCLALNSLLGQAFLYDEAEDRLHLQVLYGEATDRLGDIDQRLDLRTGRGLAGWVAKHRVPANVADVREDERWIFLDGVDDEVHSALAVPIESSGKFLGVLTVMHFARNAFHAEHMRLMQAICQELALALSNAQRYQQVQRQLAELSLIQRLTQAINQRLGVAELLDEVVKQLQNQPGYDLAAIALFESGRLNLKAAYGWETSLGAPVKLRGVLATVLETRMIAFVPHVLNEPGYHAWFDAPVVSELAAPLRQQGEFAGVVIIGSQQGNILTTQDRDLLQVLVGQISVALENAFLYETIHHHAVEMEILVAQRTAALSELYQLSQKIGYTLNYDELISLLLEHLHHAIGSDMAMGGLWFGAHSWVKLRCRQKLNASIVDQMRQSWVKIRLGTRDGDISEADEYWEVIEVDQAGLGPEAMPEIRSLIWEPLQIGNDTVGALAVASQVANAFGPTQERLLSTFANQASTALQRLAILLTAQQKQLENLVEHLPVGIVLLDASFRVLVANPLGRRLVEILNGHGNENSFDHLGRQSLENLIGRSREALPIEITSGPPNERIIAVQLRAVDAPGQDQEQQWVVLMSDITVERENALRAQVHERLATVGQLAAGIAHDFNNIMAAILVYTELLQLDQEISASGREKLAIIHQQIQRASSLIRQILDFSRRSVMEQSSLNLLPLLKEMEKMLARILPETIQVELTYQPGSYWIQGDPGRLQQVFMNLALNARDAMPDGGQLFFAMQHLTLTAQSERPVPDMADGDWIVIALRDTGVGIDPGDIQHIFEPFFTTKPHGQGAGLGLAQVYGIIQQHSGQILVNSEPGQGTTFLIYLQSSAIQQAETAPVTMVESLSGYGQVILIVEDDLATREALQTLLSACGYQTLEASNGLQALERFQDSQQRIDLVLSDMVMPKMGGVELYQTLKQHHPKLKMLLMTGHPIHEANQTWLERGQVKWLQKPFSAHQLQAAIKHLLDE
jgi:GAF domain-containing protein/ActR/RegA family two-component response regulator